MRTFEQNIARLIRIASPGAVVILGLCVSPGMVAAISGHGDVELAVLWSAAARLHVVGNWLPGFRAARGPTGRVASTLRARQGSAT
jgi:hypothetical protein